MKISRNWLKTYFNQDIPKAEELDLLLTMHSFEVEGLVKFGSDDVLDVKVLPDRAHYCLSHQGVAEEISVLTKQPLKKNRIPAAPKSTIREMPKINVVDPKFCRRYMACYVENVSVSESSAWIKSFIEAIEQRPINSLVDAANMNMFDIGQPMHIFDADKIVGSITVRAAKEGEKIVLLDGRELILTAKDNVIADDEGALVVAGAKGGKRAEVSQSTKRIMIESANFDPVAVRRTSTKHDIRSESSKRYENEITPELATEGMNNLLSLIHEIYPSAEFGPIVDIYPTKAELTIIDFDPTYIQERLGVAVPMDEAKNILRLMNIGVDDTNAGKWKLVIPFKRFDLTIREDIVEEIGRIYGYEHVKGILPPKNNDKVAILPEFYLSEKIRNILVGEGFSEVSLYTLVSKGEVETAYPLARDKSFARADLISGMMTCLEKNVLNADLLGLNCVKVFEIGRVFSKNSEQVRLSLGVAQVKKVKGVKSEDLLKAAFENLNLKLGIRLTAPKNQVKGMCAVFEIDLAEIIKSFNMNSASYTDLRFDYPKGKHFVRYSQYPFIVRDVAVFVPESTKAETVWLSVKNAINKAGADQLLTRNSLFDTFVKDGKVSYAFRMVFQSMDKTLTDPEVGKIMASIYEEIKSKNWEVR